MEHHSRKCGKGLDPRNGSVGVWRAICATVGWIPSLRTFNGTETNGASLHPRPRIMVSSEQVCSIAHSTLDMLLVCVCVSVIYRCLSVCMCMVSLLWITRLRRPVTTHESTAKPRLPFWFVVSSMMEEEPHSFLGGSIRKRFIIYYS